jgi:hypothetical protein
MAAIGNNAGGSGETSQVRTGQGELLQFVLEAHGGVERFQQLEQIAVKMFGGGFAVRSKRWGWIPGEIELVCSTRQQRTVIAPFRKTSQRSVFAGLEVRLESLIDGSVIAQRRDPRSKFPGGRRQLWWDDLDFIYFSGYAMWGYLCAPFTFTWPGVQTREIEPWEEGDEQWRRLEVTYPDAWHAHCPRQVYYFDSRGLLRRNDYTAEVFGGWAKSAHVCEGHRTFDGLVFPTKRRVYPRRRSNRRRAFPTLVEIDIHHVALH